MVSPSRRDQGWMSIPFSTLYLLDLYMDNWGITPVYYAERGPHTARGRSPVRIVCREICMEEALECANAIKGGSASIYHTTGVVYGPARDAGHLVHHQNMGWIKCAGHASTSSSYGPRTERCRLFDQSLASAETQAPLGPARGRTNSNDPRYVRAVRLCASRGPRSPRQCTTPDIIREWSYVSASQTKISTTQEM